MTDAEAFVEDLMLAKEYCLMFFETYNQIRDYASTRMGVASPTLPERLSLPDLTAND